MTIFFLKKNRICEGTKQPNDVLRIQTAKYRDLFKVAMAQVKKMDDACAQYLNEAPEVR